MRQPGTEPIEHDGLGPRIERRCRVVQDEQRRSAHECPRERDTLALAAAQADAALTHHRVDPVRKRPDEVVAGGHVERIPDVGVAHRCAEGDVVTDCPGEQEGLLEHDRTCSLCELDGAAVRSDETEREVGERRLAGSRRADECSDRASLDGEVDVDDGGHRFVAVGERHAVEDHAEAVGGRSDVIQWISTHGLGGDGLDTVPCRHRARKFRQCVADESQRQDEQREQEDHTGELADLDVSRTDAPCAEYDEPDVRQSGDDVLERLEPRPEADRLHP